MIYHSGIFYPSDRDRLAELAGERSGNADRCPKAFILPIWILEDVLDFTGRLSP